MESYLHFNCLKTFANNFLSVDPNDMNIPQLDVPGYDESNELKIKISDY
jgi:hypothetical protein